MENEPASPRSGFVDTHSNEHSDIQVFADKNDDGKSEESSGDEDGDDEFDENGHDENTENIGTAENPTDSVCTRPAQLSKKKSVRKRKMTSIVPILNRVSEIVTEKVHHAAESVHTIAVADLHEFMRALENSGYQKFMATDNYHFEEFDSGVNAMALLCALMLTIPYQLLSNMGDQYLNWLRAELVTCPHHEAHGKFSYESIYKYFRSCIVACVFSSLCGMMLCTFYFLFKRTNPDQYKLWRRKAQVMVTVMFIFTGLAMVALMLLTVFILSYYFIPSGYICEYNIRAFYIPGLTVSLIVFLGSCYLVY